MNRLLWAVIILVMAVGCSDVESPPLSVDNSHRQAPYSESDYYASSVGDNLTAGNTRFAIKSFKKLDELEVENTNIFFSPISLSIALTMAYNGAGGETYEAMKNTLEFQDMDLDEVNTQFLNLVRSLESFDDDVIIETANSAWIADYLQVRPDYIQRIVDYYLSEIHTVNFGAPETIDIINGWVEEQTNGRIEDLLVQIDPSTLMMLINALYFSGSWKYRFDESATESIPFHLPDGTVKDVLMMKDSGKDFRYYIHDDFTAARMPYGRDVISMYVFLPDRDYSVDEFISNLNWEEWDTWMNSFDDLENLIQWAFYEQHEFRLPKFQCTYSKKLNDLLISLGMGIAFLPWADFSGIVDGSMYIEYVKQKAFIDVNEQGTEAAAATVVVFLGEIGFTADRPFFFAIRDDRTGAILFMGKIIDPEYE